MTDNIRDINKIITQDKVLFFDMDGTLVDTNYANYLSFKLAIQSVINTQNVISFNPNERFNRTILQREYTNLDDKAFQDIIRLKEKLYSENIEHTKLIPFAYDVLSNYFEIHTTVLVTNCREKRALLTLNQHGLTNKFDYKFFRNQYIDTHVNKFENALNSLNLNPKKVIVFENEKFEIEEAVRAGIPIKNIISV